MIEVGALGVPVALAEPVPVALDEPVLMALDAPVPVALLGMGTLEASVEGSKNERVASPCPPSVAGEQYVPRPPSPIARMSIPGGTTVGDATPATPPDALASRAM